MTSGLRGQGLQRAATSDAAAVGVALADLGTGYWVVPIAGPDPDFPGQSDFGFTADFNAGDPPGFDASCSSWPSTATATPGTQVAHAHLHRVAHPRQRARVQAKTNAVPAVVFTLQWDTNFDLDLHVVTPDGSDVNPKTDVPSAGRRRQRRPPTTEPHIDRDSLGECVARRAGARRTSSSRTLPATGTYRIYADPFDSCGQAAGALHADHLARPGRDGSLHPTLRASGELAPAAGDRRRRRRACSSPRSSH